MNVRMMKSGFLSLWGNQGT